MADSLAWRWDMTTSILRIQTVLQSWVVTARDKTSIHLTIGSLPAITKTRKCIHLGHSQHISMHIRNIIIMKTVILVINGSQTLSQFLPMLDECTVVFRRWMEVSYTSLKLWSHDSMLHAIISMLLWPLQNTFFHIDIALFMIYDLVTIVDLQPLQRQGDVDSTYYMTKEVENGHVFSSWVHSLNVFLLFTLHCTLNTIRANVLLTWDITLATRWHGIMCGHACSPMKGLDHVVTIGVTHVVAWHRSSHVYNLTFTLLLAY